MEEEKQTAGTAAGELKSLAQETASTAKAEASRRAEGAKLSVADEIESVASALRKASGEFNDDSMEAKAFRQVAEGLAGASDSLKQNGISDMVRGINDFARRQPAAFLGAAALLGFAASRFAVASERHDNDSKGSDFSGGARPQTTPGQTATGPTSTGPSTTSSGAAPRPFQPEVRP